MNHANLRTIIAVATVALLLTPASSAAVLPAGTLGEITGAVTGAVCTGEYHYGDSSELLEVADQRTSPVLIVVAVVAIILLSSDVEQEPDVIWSYECDVTNMDLHVAGGESALRRVILEHRPASAGAYKEVASCEYDGVLVPGCTADGGTKARTPAGGESGVNNRPKKVDVCIDPDVRAINAPQEDALPPTVSPSTRKFFSGSACKTVTISWTKAPNLSQFLQGMHAREDRLTLLAEEARGPQQRATLVGPVGAGGGGTTDAEVACTLLDRGCAGGIVAAISSTISADAGVRIFGFNLDAKVQAEISFATAGGVTASLGLASHSDIVPKATVGDKSSPHSPRTCTTPTTSGSHVCGPRLATKILDEERCSTAEVETLVAVTGETASVSLEAQSDNCHEEAVRLLNSVSAQPIDHLEEVAVGNVLRVRLSDMEGALHDRILADLVAVQEQAVLDATAGWDHSHPLVADMAEALLADVQRAVLDADPAFDVEVTRA